MIKPQFGDAREHCVCEWRDFLPRICQLMADRSGSGATGIPPSSDDLRTSLGALFVLMSDQPGRPEPQSGV